MSMVESRVKSSLSLAIEMLDAIRQSANIFVEAEENELISFDDQIVPTALNIIASLVQRASKMQREELSAFVAHIQDDGPVIAKEMIAETVNRLPPIMHREYLAEKLVKTPSA